MNKNKEYKTMSDIDFWQWVNEDTSRINISGVYTRLERLAKRVDMNGRYIFGKFKELR